MNLSDLRDRYAGADVWVLGSGASLTYVDPAFWMTRPVVATNYVALGLGIYQPDVITHTHYHNDAHTLSAQFPENIFVTPLGDQGHGGEPAWRLPNVVYYSHKPTRFDFDVDEAWVDDGLIVGSSSIHGSIHLAAYMGARNIILCGADCGLIDGSSNYEGYVSDLGYDRSGNLVTNDAQFWLARWEAHLRAVKAKIEEQYATRIYSLNPFLNLNLEGHTFTGVGSNG